MNKHLWKFAIALLMPMGAFAQNSIFDNSEATSRAIGNLAQYASTESEAVIYNPAGLSFSDSKFQITLSGVGGYQRVGNMPFAINENGEKEYDLGHYSTVRRLTPSLQTFCKIGKVTLSASYANEGGGGVWVDKYGNYEMDAILHSLEGMIDTLQMAFQPLLVNDEDELRLYSENFKSKYYNRCLRVGVSYKMTQHLSAYLGIKGNQIGYTNSCGGNLYVYRPSTNERWLMSHYLDAAYDNINGSNDNLQHMDSLVNKFGEGINSSGEMRLYSFAPVFGFDINYDNWNIGAKYEMSPSLLKDYESVSFPHEISVGVSKLTWDNKLNLSIGADFKWGFRKDLSSMLKVSNSIGVLYDVVAGADYKMTENLKVKASAAYGNQYFAIRDLGFSLESVDYYTRGYVTSVKLSLGVDYSINDYFKVDFGFMATPVFGHTEEINSSIVSNVSYSPIDSHCLYRFMPRYAAGIGLTYGF